MHCGVSSCGPLHGDMFTAKASVWETCYQNSRTPYQQHSGECVHGRYIYLSGETRFLQRVTMTHQHHALSCHFNKILLPKLRTTAHLNHQRKHEAFLSLAMISEKQCWAELILGCPHSSWSPIGLEEQRESGVL